MSREVNPRTDWPFTCLKTTLISYLYPGSIRKVSLQQFDGLRRRLQTSYGLSEEKMNQAIASCIGASPNCDPKRVEEIRRRYMH
jgi:hypothetical protein